MPEITLSRQVDSKRVLLGQATVVSTGLLCLLATVSNPGKSNHNRWVSELGFPARSRIFSTGRLQRASVREANVSKTIWREKGSGFPLCLDAAAEMGLTETISMKAT